MLTPEQPPDGVHQLSREDYDALDRDNWSRIKTLRKSPAHYRHQLFGDDEDTDAKKRGRCTHLAVFEPERFRAECAIWDAGARRGKDWEAFAKKHADREILKADEATLCIAIASAVRNNQVAAKYLSGGRAEQSVLWTYRADPIGAVPGYAMRCKGRLDFIANCGAIVDLKTTKDASPEGFGRESWRYRYHSQAAFYSDGYFAATGKRLPYVLVAVEVDQPHVVQVYRVPDVALEAGREEYRSLLDLLRHCRAESQWGGYAEGELELQIPGWAGITEEDASGLDLEFNTQEA